MPVMPQERQRTRRFALALDGVAVHDPQVASLTWIAGALSATPAPSPSDEFRGALRQHLLAVGATAPATHAPASGPWRRRLVAAGAALAISTGSAAGTAVASSDALPGDRLYEVKRAVENVQLTLAFSDAAKAEQYLEIAGTRIEEIEGLLAEADGFTDDPVLVERLRKTLGAMSEAVASGSALYFDAFEGSGDATVLGPLERFLQERTDTFDQLRSLLPFQLLDEQGAVATELDRLAQRVAALADPSAVGTAGESATGTATRADALFGGSDADDLLSVGVSRSHGDREAIATETSVPSIEDTVDSVGDRLASVVESAAAHAEKVSDARESAARDEAAAQARAVEDNVDKLVKVDVQSKATKDRQRRGVHIDTGSSAKELGLPSASVSIGESESADGSASVTKATSATDLAHSDLLDLLPLPAASIDTATPGSLAAEFAVDAEKIRRAASGAAGFDHEG